jgi:hypothetical protein
LAGRPALDDDAFAALFPAGQGELAVALRELLVPHAKVDLVYLRPEDRLLADLHLNEFHKTALAEYIMAIEERYEVLFPDRDALDHATFGELVAALHALRQPAA